MIDVEAARRVQDPFLLEGAIFDQKYRVERVVAEGGFGVVYRGHHVSLDVPIAIKVLKPARADGSGTRAHEHVENFAREAQTVARLVHPSIVRVLDYGIWRAETAMTESVSLPFMVLEWLAGQTLKADLACRRGCGGRTPAETLALMRPVFEAVRYAHDTRVAHRDLKPSNIMLSPGPGGTAIKVLDFGIAKIMDDEPPPDTGETRTGGSSHVFSRSYAAPEQLAGARTGPWTDIHALGLLLTELLTDEPPYGTSDPTELY